MPVMLIRHSLGGVGSQDYLIIEEPPNKFSQALLKFIQRKTLS